jgi:hypothetical protein
VILDLELQRDLEEKMKSGVLDLVILDAAKKQVVDHMDKYYYKQFFEHQVYKGYVQVIWCF